MVKKNIYYLPLPLEVNKLNPTSVELLVGDLRKMVTVKTLDPLYYLRQRLTQCQMLIALNATDVEFSRSNFALESGRLTNNIPQIRAKVTAVARSYVKQKMGSYNMALSRMEKDAAMPKNQEFTPKLPVLLTG